MLRVWGSSARRYCGDVIKRSVTVGGATITYEGPKDTFKNMSEESFYREDEFHEFWGGLGLEVFKPEESGIPSSSNSSSETTVEEPPKPKTEADLPPIFESLREISLDGISVDTSIWKIKKQIEEKSGVSDNDFDMYIGMKKIDDHLVVAQILEKLETTELDLVARHKES